MQNSCDGPTVSVIIPIYNAEKYISEAIESVLRQSIKDFECILVNDGSTDGSKEICLNYVANFPNVIRVVEHDGGVNRGLPASRNLGFNLSRGKFIAPLDADDVWDFDRLESQLAIFEKHDELGMVCGSACYWSSWEGGTDRMVRCGHVQDSVVQPPEAALQVYPIGNGEAPCPSGWLLRREAILATGAWEPQFSGARALFEDQAFLVKLYLKWPVYFSSAPWGKYRRHEASIMSSVLKAGQKEEVRNFFFDWLLDFCRRSHPEEVKVIAAARKKRLSHRRAQLRNGLKKRLSSSFAPLRAGRR